MLNQTVNIAELQENRTLGRQGTLIPLTGLSPIPIEGIVTIGRSPENDVKLEDLHVSAFHCQVEQRPHGFFIRDLKSRNGVLVNGSKVMEGQLLPGSHVVVGTTEFFFQAKRDGIDDFPMRSRNEDWGTRLKTLPQFASTDLAVFLQGESGTGKEVLARLVHDQSKRRHGPFITVNCSALTETLVESELFGHVKGSFTGATNDRRGAFEAARGGTLFLDEIGDLPMVLQPKLLRALENREIRPVGSDKVISTDVRIITATHKNLTKLVSENLFRADLFFRIHVIRLPIPALRNRMEDFDDLLYLFCREHRVRFSVAAIESLREHSWPGNIRELKNAVARASALFPQTYIQPEHVLQLIDRPHSPGFDHHEPMVDASGNQPSFLKEVEREIIRQRLLANRGNQRKTAAELGIPKSTLHDRLKAYKIEVKSLLEL